MALPRSPAAAHAPTAAETTHRTCVLCCNAIRSASAVSVTMSPRYSGRQCAVAARCQRVLCGRARSSVRVASAGARATGSASSDGTLRAQCRAQQLQRQLLLRQRAAAPSAGPGLHPRGSARRLQNLVVRRRAPARRPQAHDVTTVAVTKASHHDRHRHTTPRRLPPCLRARADNAPVELEPRLARLHRQFRGRRRRECLRYSRPHQLLLRRCSVRTTWSFSGTQWV